MSHKQSSSVNAIFRINNLSGRLFGPISLSVDTHECIALSGPSGAGKSVLLRAIADLDPSEGEVWLGEQRRDQYTPTQWRQQVGYLPAESRWWADTVGEHFTDTSGLPFKSLGFDDDVLLWQVNRLSSGERQRLAVLRLLGNNPKVMLLDEPTANLDNDNTLLIEGIVQRYLEEQNACVLWVSHSGSQIARIAKRHCRLSKGTLEEKVAA